MKHTASKSVIALLVFSRRKHTVYRTNTYVVLTTACASHWIYVIAFPKFIHPHEDTVTGGRETDFCHYNPALLSGVDYQVPLYSWVLHRLAPPKPLTSYHLEKITSLLMESLLSMILNFFYAPQA